MGKRGLCLWWVCCFQTFHIVCLSICLHIRPSIRFWFLLLILLNNLSEGSHYLADIGARAVCGWGMW